MHSGLKAKKVPIVLENVKRFVKYNPIDYDIWHMIAQMFFKVSNGVAWRKEKGEEKISK